MAENISTIDGLNDGTSLPKVIETDGSPDGEIDIVVGSQLVNDTNNNQLYMSDGNAGSSWIKVGSIA